MSDFEAHFAAVRERFKARLLERMASLRMAASRQADAPSDETGIATIKQLAHDLAGSCGTFGFPALGEIAAKLEEAAGRALRGRGEDLGTPLQQLIAAVEATLAESKLA